MYQFTGPSNGPMFRRSFWRRAQNLILDSARMTVGKKIARFAKCDTLLTLVN